MTEITDINEYNWAVERVEQILKTLDAIESNVVDEPVAAYGNSSPNYSKESLEIELKLLSDLVSDYSDKHFSVGTPKLAEVIQLRMYERGLSQKAVAELLGISPARICEYLSGKTEPTLQIAREISRKLDIDPSIVLGV